MHRRTARSEEGPRALLGGGPRLPASTSTPRQAIEEEEEARQHVRSRKWTGGSAGAGAAGGGTVRRQIQSRCVACVLCASVLLPLFAWGALLGRLLWADLGRPLPRLRGPARATAVADDDGIHNECDRGRGPRQETNAFPEDDDATTGHSRRRKVFVFPPNLTDGDEPKHIFFDGIAQSTRLDLSLDLCDRNVVDWVVDINRCTEDQLKTAMRQRTSAPEGSGERDKVSVVLMDWSDFGFEDDDLEALLLLASHYFGRGNVHYVTRQLMDNRNIQNISNGKEFSDYGVRWSWDEEGEKFGLGGRIKAARYPVRSDLVRSISKVSGTIVDGSSASTSAITKRPRSKDVASFWSPDDVTDPMQWDEVTTELRASVSKLVASLGRGETRLNVTTAVVGERETVGRNTVDDAYARALLNHKIVVVAQRDGWEGHYRLMEALSGGALVMSDPMHPFPYLIQDGENIVVYSSLRDLKEKILYYIRNESERLKIAARGHRVAMNHHRSWHVMERIVLGNWTSEHF